MKLAKTFEEFQINEGLQSDLKKFIKKNRDELNDMADNDNWDGIYQLLYQEFDIEDLESDKAKDLKQTFDFMF
jgi:hypothetical protein